MQVNLRSIKFEVQETLFKQYTTISELFKHFVGNTS